MAVQVTVEEAGKQTKISLEKGQSILDTLTKQGIYVSAACGGKGRCGKCKIQVTEGTLPVTKGDAQKLSEEELASGIRLSCLAFPEEDCKIRLLAQQDENFDVLSKEVESPMTAESGYGIAVDIGTTTLAMVLV